MLRGTPTGPIAVDLSNIYTRTPVVSDTADIDNVPANGILTFVHREL